jgi:hypothetical protein
LRPLAEDLVRRRIAVIVAAGGENSIIAAQNELATSVARNVAWTSPSQIAIACSTAASKGSDGSDAASAINPPRAAAARPDASIVRTQQEHVNLPEVGNGLN